MEEFILIQTTTETREDAVRISRELVEKRLAACVQIIGPITSIYRWQGRVEEAEEFLCQIKTRNELFSQIKENLRKIHPYQVPEIVSIPITKGAESYCDWLRRETS